MLEEAATTDYRKTSNHLSRPERSLQGVDGNTLGLLSRFLLATEQLEVLQLQKVCHLVSVPSVYGFHRLLQGPA